MDFWRFGFATEWKSRNLRVPGGLRRWTSGERFHQHFSNFEIPEANGQTKHCNSFSSRAQRYIQTEQIYTWKLQKVKILVGHSKIRCLDERTFQANYPRCYRQSCLPWTWCRQFTGRVSSPLHSFSNWPFQSGFYANPSSVLQWHLPEYSRENGWTIRQPSQKTKRSNRFSIEVKITKQITWNINT